MRKNLERQIAEAHLYGGKIPMADLIRAFNIANAKHRDNQIIKTVLIEHYLPQVNKLAQDIANKTNVSLEELLGEGNLAVVEYFQRKHLYPTFSAHLLEAVDRRLAKYALNVITDNLKREHCDLTYEPDYDLKIDVLGGMKETLESRVDRILKGRLSPREEHVLTNLFGFYTDEPVNLKKIGDAIGLSPERVRQIGAKAIEKLRDMRAYYSLLEIYYMDPEREFYGMATKVLPSESEDPIEALDIELQRIQSVTLSTLAGLPLKPFYFYSLIRDMTGLKIKKQEQGEIYKKYIQPSIMQKAPKETKQGLYKKIMEYLGATPREFMIYTSMLEDHFIKYLQDKFPQVEEERLRKIIALNPNESQNKHIVPSSDKKELILLERVLSLLQNNQYRKYFHGFFDKASERLKHALFPIYVQDPDKCINMLAEKIQAYDDPSIRKCLLNAYGFFRKSLDMRFPRLRTELDNFQKADVLTLVEKGRYILASETGIGKSLEVIATAEWLNIERVFIISNKTSLEATWRKEIRKHLGEPAVVITGDDHDKEPLFKAAQDSRWVITTYETYRRNAKRFQELKPEMVVIDEADIMNSYKSLRTQAIRDLKAKYEYCISGWIFKNRRTELWPILNWLYPEEYPIRASFLREYGRNEWGLLKLKYELSHKVIFRPKSLVLPGLPKVEMEPIQLNLPEKEKQTYDRAEMDFVDWYKENNGKVPSGVAMTKMHSLRRLSLTPKFEALYSEMEKLRPEDKAVVYCWYIDEAKEIASMLSQRFGVRYFDGQSPVKERQSAIQAFNNKTDCQAIVMSDAGAKSIELTAGNHLYLFNPVWTYSMKKQIMDRLHRRGQKRKVHVHDMITSGTIEEHIAERTEQKRKEYESTITDTLGYSTWFEENEDSIIALIAGDIIRKYDGSAKFQ